MKNIVDLTESNFETEILDANLPVLVDFFATWCGPCRMLAPVLESLAQEFAGRVKFAKIDVDQAPGLAGAFNITGVPTLILFRNGEPIQQMVGVGSVKSLRSLLEKSVEAEATGA